MLLIRVDNAAEDQPMYSARVWHSPTVGENLPENSNRSVKGEGVFTHVPGLCFPALSPQVVSV